MRLALLASGSKGNAAYLEGDGCGVLVDAGLSRRELLARLTGLGVGPERLAAIIVSHEHGDHVTAAGSLARLLKIPLYATAATRAALDDRLKAVDWREIHVNASFAIGPLTFKTFATSHDSADPFGLTMACSAGRLGFATDLGLATRLLQTELAGCRALILEANHDEELLRDGPYPWHLKQRIRSRQGHLSNRECGAALAELAGPELELVLLAHLSETNNRPELAFTEVGAALAATGHAPQLVVGSQQAATPLFSLA